MKVLMLFLTIKTNILIVENWGNTKKYKMKNFNNLNHIVLT